MRHTLPWYTRLFSVDEALLQSLTGLALSRGGDFADLFFERTDCNVFMLRDGVVAAGGFHEDFGAGIRTLCGDKTGYAYAESTRPEDLRSAAQAASAIAPGIRVGETDPLASGASAAGEGRRLAEKPVLASLRDVTSTLEDYYPVKQPWQELAPTQAAAFLESLRDRIEGRDTRMVKLIGMLTYESRDILMANSLGEIAVDTRPMGTVALSLVFAHGGESVSRSVSRSFRRGAEMLDDALADEMATQALREVDLLFEARRPKGGQMSVVMGAGASGILLHEAMGHAFEADFIRKGQSIFTDKMDRQVCSPEITILDDATLPGNRGAVNVDDEGVPGQRTVMVRDGVLRSFLHDRISARHFGVAPTGNGRRESFRYAPIPRMRATYMASGSATPESLIASVRKGLYVDEFSNGQVKIGEGDFTFFVKSGRLIENGRLTRPVKDINVIGNGPEALADIVGVGNDLVVDPGAWTCGKEQDAAVSCGMPTVLVNRLTVGGD